MYFRGTCDVNIFVTLSSCAAFSGGCRAGKAAGHEAFCFWDLVESLCGSLQLFQIDCRYIDKCSNSLVYNTAYSFIVIGRIAG